MPDGQTYIPLETPVVEAWRTVLLDAADYIEAHGWCQNSHKTHDGRVCLVGALDSVTKNDRFSAGFQEAWLRIATHVDAQLAAEDHNPVPAHWNDTPGRTAAEVTAALRECARS